MTEPKHPGPPPNLNQDSEETLRALAAVRQEKEKLAALINSISDEVWLTDAEGTFTLANPSARKEFALQPGETVPVEKLATQLEVLRPDGSPRPLHEAPPLRALAGERVRNQQEIVRTPATGELRHRQVSASPIRDATGRIVGSVAVVRDITESWRAQERYRSLVETARSAILFMDLDHRILEWNRAAEEVFGYGREEVLGQDFVRLFIPDSRQGAIGSEIDKVLSGEPLQGYEGSVVRKDGTVRTLLWNATRFQVSDGNPEGLFIIGQDITLRRRAEQQVEALNTELERKVQARTAQLEEANRELEAFSYSVSHDLRAPLRAIEGLTQALQEDHATHLDDEGRRLMAAIRSNAKRMGQLIGDLLTLSRAGRKELVRTKVDMADLARTVFLEVAGPQACERVSFTVSDLPAAWGDASLLRQVWENLLANALKFSSGKESPWIEVSSDEVDGKVIYLVRDNGAGFDPDYAHKLFKPFQRLHGETEFEGTGIGLAIVRRILHRHGGSVWAEGRPGEGATFSFTLPTRAARRE